jgi:polyhydroxyalkanoate synthesis regulator phasin
MRQLLNDIQFYETHNRLGLKINSHLQGLDKSKKDDNQKILELCQIGKLLATYFNDFEITRVTEKPDFIISNGQEHYGLEHELILDTKAKSQEGFYENICKKVEASLENDPSVPNVLVNLYLKDNLCFKINDKNSLIEKLTELVKQFVLTGELEANEIVSHANKMKHSQKSVNANFGAYWQKTITKDLILEYVSKKENKISTYRQKTDLRQWLVLVIGGVGQSSFEVNELLNFDITSDFDKIFLYEDFDNKLYELK